MEKQIIELLLEDVSQREIASRLNVSRSYVKKVGVKNNIIKMPITEQYEESYKLWLNGYSLTEITTRMKVSRQWLSLYIKQKGAKINNPSIKYSYNENVFKKIDNEEKAYWLGFIAADGCINDTKSSKYLEIGLSSKDEEHLKKFCKFIGLSDENIKHKQTYLKATNKIYNVSRVGIYNSKICNDLINIGVTPRKSETHQFYKEIENELKFHYLRGYVDGDGYFRKHSKNSYELVIIGSVSFIEYMIKFFNFGSYRIGKKSKSGNVVQISLNSKDSKYAIENMYLDSNIYLDRKYHKAITVLGRNI